MLFACDLNKLRIKPLPNTKGICPICNNEVIAVCGQINMHHWRHKPNTNCNPWKEHETEWHRKWKNEFPESWQEIIIVEDNEKHIADIKTENGLVIEFQNSSILSETIQIREEFYKNMIWVVNADKFKDNFKILSLVTNKLDELLSDFSGYYDDIEEYLKKNQEIEFEKKNLIEEIYQKEKTFLRIDGDLANFENYFNDYFNDLENDFGNFRNLLDTEKNYLNNSKIIDNLMDKRKISEQKLNIYNSYERCKIKNYTFCVKINFNNINKDKYNICKVYKREEENKLFPKIISLKSQSEFSWYSSQKDYQLIVDIRYYEKKYKNRMKDIINEIKIIQNENTVLLIKLKNDVFYGLMDRKNELSEEINKLKNELREIKEKQNKVKENYNIEKEKEHNSNDYGKAEQRIKHNYKGRYEYCWNKRRPSWDYSNKPIYLDFGTHLFKIISKNEFQKIEKKYFIKQVLNNTIS